MSVNDIVYPTVFFLMILYVLYIISTMVIMSMNIDVPDHYVYIVAAAVFIYVVYVLYLDDLLLMIGVDLI